MDEIEEEKLRAILKTEQTFIDNINYSNEPVIHPIDPLNGFLIHNVPKHILEILGSQINSINLASSSANYLGTYQLNKKYVAGNSVTYDDKNYICMVSTESGILPTNKSFWALDTNQNPKSNGSIHYSLAGHIQNQHSLYLDSELEEYIFYLSNRYFQKYPNFVFNIFKYNALDEKTKLNLKIYALWVNFMKKYEFNPIHSHSGRLSFVIWYKVPFYIEDEIRYGPSKRVDNDNFTACFQFIHPVNDETGIGFKSLRVDKSYEGKIILFPSYLSHAVYPFYTSNDYRISIAGNIKCENGE